MRTSREEIFRLHASICKGLADPKRLLLIDALRDGERSVTDLCEELDLPQANISQHLAIMRDKGLVVARREGQWVYYSLISPKIVEAMDLLRQVMALQLRGAATAPLIEGGSRVNVQAIRTSGLGDTSYLLIHDGTGLIVDPQRDADRFVEAAGEIDIRYVLETHLHNDYISGGREVARRTGAELVLPAGAGAAFDHTPAFHNEDLGAGLLTVRPLHTPGHTPEHVSYLVIIDGEPVAVFSGGSLLVGAAGRTDLLGESRARQLARLQYVSIHRLAGLPDGVGLYPTHGAGSFCTTTVAGAATSTIGEERRSNPIMRHADEDAFVEAQLSGLQPYPRYYQHMGPINLLGPKPLIAVEAPQLNDADMAELPDDVQVIDARPKQSYAQGHLPGSWGIELNEDFVTWVGWLLPYNAPIVLMLDPEQDSEEATVGLARIGFEDIRGVFRDMSEWIQKGGAVESHRTMTARQFIEVAGQPPAQQVLDVRSPQEWEDDHLEGSIHCYLPDLLLGPPANLDNTRPVYVGCTTGHRASTAAGLLLKWGYQPIVLVGASLLGVLALRQPQAVTPV